MNTYKVTWYALGAAQGPLTVQAAEVIYDRDTVVLLDTNKQAVLYVPMDLTPVVQLVAA